MDHIYRNFASDLDQSCVLHSAKLYSENVFTYLYRLQDKYAADRRTNSEYFLQGWDKRDQQQQLNLSLGKSKQIDEIKDNRYINSSDLFFIA